MTLSELWVPHNLLLPPKPPVQEAPRDQIHNPTVSEIFLLLWVLLKRLKYENQNVWVSLVAAACSLLFMLRHGENLSMQNKGLGNKAWRRT